MFESLRQRIALPSAPRLFVPGFLRPVALRRVHVFHGLSWQTDRHGRLLWVEEGPVDNILHDEGEQYILARAFDTDLTGYSSTPTNLWLGLDARATLAEADTLASITGEPTLGGYARKSVSTTAGFTITQPGAYYQAATGTLAFTASGGNYGTVKNRFLATTSDASGKLICSLALSADRTVNDGDTLNVSLTIGLSE